MDRSSSASQPNSLLATKLYVPQPQSNRVARARLTHRLDEGVKRKLTLLSAPPGFGKTTALSEWIAQCPYRVGWLSLDEGDNDPVRFWSYFIASLQKLNSSIGTNALGLLKSPAPSYIESVLTTLVNEIDAFPDSYALVLDDFHVIDSQPILDGLGFLLEHLPPRMHLIITSRADPLLPLAQLRARAELVELREVDLRFTLEEATAFLNAGMGLRLNPAQIAALGKRTEGWIAGLQLAALSMRGEEDPSEFVTTFTGEHRYIIDYLTDQVLERQSESIQDFLLQTSILDRLNASLCDAVTGRTDSREVLELLEQRNLFLIPLDDARHWYRYHRLFADVLHHRLGETRSSVAPELHRRASEWLKREGAVSEAMRHAIAGQDWEQAVHLIVDVAEVLRQSGEITTLASWMQALPDAVRHRHPGACLAYARVLIDTAQFPAAEALVAEAEQAIETTAPDEEAPAATLTGQALAVRAYLSMTRSDFDQATELSSRALERLPSDELVWRRLVALALAGAFRFSSNWAAASQTYLEAATLSQSVGDLVNALSAYSLRGEVLQAQGQLRQAVRQYDQVIELAQERGLARAPVAGYALVGLARAWCEWNDLDAALLYTQSGLERGKQANILDISLRAYLVLTRIRLAHQDASGALNALDEADAIAQFMGVAELRDWIDALRAQSRMAQGDMEAAIKWASQFHGKLNDAVYPGVPYGLAQVWLTAGEPEKAVPLVDHALQSAQAVGRFGNVVTLLALKAVVLHATGDSAQALATLGQALELAEPEGYVRAFVEAGASMERLLQRFAARGETAKYVKQLLTALGEPPGSESPPSSGLIEALTRREADVLRLIAAGATNQEIARELVLTVNTVKKHTSNIFAKLSVSNRAHAIARARELNLL